VTSRIFLGREVFMAGLDVMVVWREEQPGDDDDG
jgi:hypothetical protein